MGDVIKLNLRFQNRFWEDVKLPGTKESLEDLGFLCMRPWRFGNDDAEAGGFGSRADVYRAYEQAGAGAATAAPESPRKAARGKTAG